MRVLTTKLSKIALALVVVSGLSACATSNKELRNTERLTTETLDKDIETSIDAAKELWKKKEKDITYIHRETELYSQKANSIPSKIINKKIVGLTMNPKAKLFHLVGSMRLYGIELIFDERNLEGKDEASKSGKTPPQNNNTDVKEKKADTISGRSFPLRKYTGTVGELLTVIENLHDISFEYLGGNMIVARPSVRYTVSIPQNPKAIESLKSAFEDLGAKSVKTNLLAGSATYIASASEQKDIDKYLDRFYENFAGVNLQLSVFTVSLDKTASEGFNWSEIDFILGSVNAATAGDVLTQLGTTAVSAAAGVGTAVTGGDVNSGVGGNTSSNTNSSSGSTGETSEWGAKSLFDGSNMSDTKSFGRMGGNGFSMGAYNDNLAVDLAIDWLNQYGSTKTTQSVYLGTVTGKETEIKASKNVPFVSNIGTSFVGNSQPIASSNVETDSKEVGMTVKFLPYYESSSQEIFLDLSVDLKNIVGTERLSSGTGTGFEQPVIQEQSFPTSLRMKAGETKLVGGIIFDTLIETRSKPNVLESDDNEYVKQTLSKSAMFVLLRPTVQLFKRSKSEKK
jgi:hypothetical protein